YDVRRKAMPAASPLSRVNDFVVRFANVNGSGSASANEIFARAVLRMGVPVSPRNIFPSNIQGLPTWYEVRVSGDGHLGARGGVDLMVAMNPQTWEKDVASLEPGGYLLYDATKPLPSSPLADAFTRHSNRLRVVPATKQNKFAIVQAEDELASIGVVIGAAWNGARAFTATSGPGISLMQEFIGLAYFAEIPAVIFDVQRGSPSTGMPTRTQQADILSCAYASHGDTKHILLFPQDPNEAFTFAADALDLTDRLQTPIFVMLDLDIGMNDWLVPPLKWDPARQYDRGKVMTHDD